MENIVDATYREVVDLTALSTDELAQQANTIYQQAESVAAVSLQLVAEAGKRLIVIKERIGHGGWEEWMEKNLTFSGRKANRMMKLAEKMEDEGSLFANPTTLSDIGISKVWALLSAPEEVAAEVISDADAESMTVKELKAEIERIKQENEALGEDKRTLMELRGKVFSQASRISELEEQIAQTESTEELEQKLEAAKRNLQNTKEKLTAEKEKVKAAVERAKADAKRDAEKAAEEAIKAEAGKTEGIVKQVREEEAEKRAELEAENLKLKKMADPVMTEFKVKVDVLQQSFAACLSPIASADEEMSEKMKKALKVVLGRMEGQL